MTEAADRQDALAPWLRRLTRGTLAFYLLVSGYVLWRTAVLTPYADELHWIERWRDAAASGDWIGYLFAPFNFHRFPLTLGLLALDVRAFGGTNAPLILSGALSLVVMAWALGRQAAHAAPAGLAPPAAAVAVMLALVASNIMDASQPICVTYTHGAVFAVLAIIFAEGRTDTSPGWHSAAALGCALASGLGDAAGLAVWPVLAWGALRRRDWRWLAILLVIGGSFVGTYASGLGASTARVASGAFDDPMAAVRIALAVIALPWASIARAYAAVPGLVVTMLAAGALLTRGGPDASSSERVACGFILFSVGTALMTGLGRTGLISPLEVPARYAIFITPLHVGFLMLALPTIGTRWRRNRRAWQYGSGSLLVVLMAQQGVLAAKMIGSGDLIRTTVAAFRNGHVTDKTDMFVSRDLPRARDIYAGLSRDGLFRHELHLGDAHKPAMVDTPAPGAVHDAGRPAPR